MPAGAHHGEVPRPEHPNPIFRRDEWLNLNGSSWNYTVCSAKRTEPPDEWDGTIRVPFCLQSSLSGIKDKSFAPPLAHSLKHTEALWYCRELPPLPKSWRDGSKRILLHIGACDGTATVIVNGHEFPEHCGGSTPFSHDITKALTPGGAGPDKLLLRCLEASCEGILQPCGKQLGRRSEYSGAGPHLPTLYSNVSGIWQTVWLEAVSQQVHLVNVKVAPQLAANGKTWFLNLLPQLSAIQSSSIASHSLTFQAELFNGDSSDSIVSGRRLLRGRGQQPLQLRIPSSAVQQWSPEKPFLYRLRLRLSAGRQVIDEVASYTAFRSVVCKGDQVILNGEPRYLRLVLDQGYYPDGIWTAPSSDHIRRDIEHAKTIGFNGARLHQKVFEPLYFFYADLLGFLVISEYPDWPGGVTRRWKLTEGYKDIVRREWECVVAHQHNHPSIIMWGPFNEFGPKDGWEYNRGAGGGFKNMFPLQKRSAIIRDQKTFVKDVVQRIRKQDMQKRPVHDSSGWIHVSTDLWSFHEYNQRPAAFKAILDDPPPKYVEGRGRQPLIVGEYAGVGLEAGGPYGTNPKKFLVGYPGKPGLPVTKAEAVARIEALTTQIYEAPHIAGFCCTQLYDVEYEKNGLLRYDRKPKFSIERLQRVFDGRLQTGRWIGSGVRRHINKKKVVPRWLRKATGPRRAPQHAKSR